MTDKPNGLTFREQIGGLASWVDVLLGRSVEFAKSTSGGRLVALSLFAVLFLYFSGLMAFVESRVRDFGPLSNPDAEGVIIVDAPQLFTRERLLNDRLLESEWLDDQIKHVNDKLNKGEFGRPNTVKLSEVLLKLKVGPAVDHQENIVASDADKAEEQSHNNRMNVQDVFKILKEADEFAAPPLESFEAANNFRERLSQQRYATILDDAHDLGENTLHRLNFHLTIVPARASTDWLAAVSVRLRETLDHSRVLDMYSRLMVEAQKKMQESVEQVFLDKSLMFNDETEYSIDPTEERSIIEIVDKQLLGEMASWKSDINSTDIDSIINIPLNQEINRQRELTMKGIASFLEKNDPIGYYSDLFVGESGKRALEGAAEKIGGNCGAYSLAELINTENGKEKLSKYRKSISELQTRLAIYQERAERQKYMQQPSTTLSANTLAPVSYPPASPIIQLEREISSRIELLWQKQLSMKCIYIRNYQMVARFRVLGILHYINLHGVGKSSDCNSLLTMKGIVEVVLGVKSSYTQNLGGACYRWRKAAENIKTRLDATGAEIGHTGLAKMLRQFLEERLMETALRHVNLGRFFRFSTESCTIESCPVRVHALSENYGEDNNEGGQDEVAKDMADETAKPKFSESEIGQREALRLFLHLNCFASLRTYAVSPRAGERDIAVAEERESVDGSFADLFAVQGDARVNRTTASRSYQDHIVGMGDWGNRAEDDTIERNAVKANEPCTPELMDVLARYNVKDDFSLFVRNEIIKEKEEMEENREKSTIAEIDKTMSIVGPREYWWNKYAVKECVRLTKARTLKSTNCRDPDIQTLAAVAVSQKVRTASVGWIVSPRTDGTDAYQRQ